MKKVKQSVSLLSELVYRLSCTAKMSTFCCYEAKIRNIDFTTNTNIACQLVVHIFDSIFFNFNPLHSSHLTVNIRAVSSAFKMKYLLLYSKIFFIKRP